MSEDKIRKVSIARKDFNSEIQNLYEMAQSVRCLGLDSMTDELGASIKILNDFCNELYQAWSDELGNRCDDAKRSLGNVLSAVLNSNLPKIEDE